METNFIFTCFIVILKKEKAKKMKGYKMEVSCSRTKM